MQTLIETGYTDPNTAAERTRVILELLRHRHPAPEWATFAELATATGGTHGARYIDFYAFNLWPSKRFVKIAYEIKVSRSDFFREIDDPTKREPAERVADECYFVTPAGLIQPDEVPAGWGLIELVSNGLRRKKVATQHKVTELPLLFVVSLARQSSLPKPIFPATTWLMAGKELSEDDLIAAATLAMDMSRYEMREEVRRELRDSTGYQTMRELRDLVSRSLGYHMASNPKLFEVWLTKRQGEQPPPDPEAKRRLLQRLNSIKRMAEELIKLQEEL